MAHIFDESFCVKYVRVIVIVTCFVVSENFWDEINGDWGAQCFFNIFTRQFCSDKL